MSKSTIRKLLRELKVEQRPIEALRPNPRNPRAHSGKQITQIEASIRRFGFTSPILIDDDDTVLAGHGRLEAARALGMQAVPTIRVTDLTPSERRAFLLADNRLAELSGWDPDLLAVELQELASIDLDFDLEITGFDGAELDKLLGLAAPDDRPDPKEDQIPEAQGPAVTRLGDLWVSGRHRLVCADARNRLAYEQLLQGELARMVFTDPPYNVRIDGNVGGKGKVARRPFVMGCGEMSRPEFTTFLTEILAHLVAFSLDGAIHYISMDWRHIGELLKAGEVYDELKNLIVWAKPNAGLYVVRTFGTDGVRI